MTFGPSDSLLGKTLAGKYRVDGRLGEGGIGAVYVAEQLNLGRKVAVKVLHERIASTPNAHARFRREARALGMLKHPNIVMVIDDGTEGDQAFLVMDLIEGDPLTSRLLAGLMPRAKALNVMRQILAALAYAHGQGIVHRDLKPANVLVRAMPDGSEHVTVLDFGLAKFVGGVVEPADHGEVGVTRQGAILGTPAYMAPEQATGDSVGPAADVYSATLILFELLTGKRAFVGREAGELLKAHLVGPIPSLNETLNELPFSRELEAFVSRGLAKRAGDRFPDARAMLEAFDALPESLGTVVDPRVSGALALDSTERSSRGSMAVGIFATVLGIAGIGALAFLVHTFTSVPDPVVPERPNVVDASSLILNFPPVADAGSPAPEASLDAALDTSIDGAIDEAVDGSLDDAAIIDGAIDGALAAESTRIPARDPFSVGVPNELEELYEEISRGEQPSRDDLQVLYRYASASPRDPRAHLLLGRTYTDRGWASDAMNAYREAHFRDASSRGDARMLRDLVSLASSKRSEDRARGYVIGFYGSEAQPFVARVLETTTDPEARALLERLLSDLAHTP